LLRTVSLSNGLSNHLVFVICYLKFIITENLNNDTWKPYVFFTTCCQKKAPRGLDSPCQAEHIDVGCAMV
jgi:hypothetical protein